MDSAASQLIASLDPNLARHWPAALTMPEVEALLVKAINKRKVAACVAALQELPEGCLGFEACALVQAAQDACRLIDEETNTEQDRFIALLRAAGIEAIPKQNRSFGKQIHSFELRVAPDDLDAALIVADADGFRRWAPTEGAGWRSYRLTHTEVTLIRTDDVTTRCVLRWSNAKRPGRLRKLMQPSIVDYRLIDLPTPLWPLYHVLRPLRLMFDRLVRFRRQSASIFLGTPLSLVPPLLEFGQVTAADRIVDLGCGDGRILVYAAQHLGCTAYGVEQDPAYAQVARDRVEDASVGDRVEIEVADAASAELDGATVVFLFLPQDAIRRFVPQLLKCLPSGARVLAHEQVPLHASLNPDETVPLFVKNAITVAHRWDISQQMH